MEEKKADNSFVEYKSKINALEQDIDDGKNFLKDLNNLKDLSIELNNDLKDLNNALRKSFKGKKITAELDENSYNNLKQFNEVIDEIDNDYRDVRDYITELYGKKDELQRKRREEETKEE